MGLIGLGLGLWASVEAQSPAGYSPDVALGSACRAYWDAAKSAMVTTDGSSTVTAWADVVNGYTFDLREGAPTLNPSGINGAPSIDFDGVDDFLYMNSQPLGQGPLEAWFLLDQREPDTTSGNRYFFGIGDVSGNQMVCGQRVASGENRMRIIAPEGTGQSATVGGIAFNGVSVARYTFGSTANSTEQNGAADINKAYTLGGTMENVVVAGAFKFGSNFSAEFNCRIRAIVVTDILDEADAAPLRDWLTSLAA